MILTETQTNQLIKCGQFNFSATKCAIKLDIPHAQHAEFIMHFENYDSKIRKMYEMGKINTEFEIMEALEAKIHDGGEGCDEAAKALNTMRKNQTYNEQLKEYYNL